MDQKKLEFAIREVDDLNVEVNEFYKDINCSLDSDEGAAMKLFQLVNKSAFIAIENCVIKQYKDKMRNLEYDKDYF